MIWKIWKYALGSFADEKTKDYDNYVVIVRSIIFVSYLITNCFIISGVIRHWNNRSECDKYSYGTQERQRASTGRRGQLG